MCEMCAAYGESHRKQLERVANAIEDGQKREIPTLNLAALGMYPGDRMTISAIKEQMVLTGAVANDVVGEAIISEPSVTLVNLHKLPGMAINAYPMIKDVSVVTRVTAGTLVTPFSLIGVLIYEDNAFKPHVVGALSLSNPTVIAPTDSSLRASQTSFQNIIISASPMGENAPANFGRWRIEGDLVLGTATQITIDIWCNFGALYGVPK